MTITTQNQTLLQAIEGGSRNGMVGFRQFDQGVIETLGAVVVSDPTNQTGYYLQNVPGLPQAIVPPSISKPVTKASSPTNVTSTISGPGGWQGVPVVFANPEDRYERYMLPMVLVRRDGIDPAMQRWHPGAEQWRVPALGATPVTVNVNNSINPVLLSGFSKTETQQQAVPFDLSYTIRVVSKYRGSSGSTVVANQNHVNALVLYVMKIYQPYCAVNVTDTNGDKRSYEAFAEAVGISDQSFEIADRIVAFDINLRVEAELDLLDPQVSNAVSSPPQISYTPNS